MGPISWTTFPTLTDGQVLTGAHMQLVRDNFAETAPGKATTAGRWFISTGLNSVAQRAIETAYVATSEATASTSYVDLATPGPAVTLETGTRAIVILTVQGSNATASAATLASYAVSGASTIAAADTDAWWSDGLSSASALRMSVVNVQEGLTAGSNVFTMKYRAGSGTATFLRRRLTVMAL